MISFNLLDPNKSCVFLKRIALTKSKLFYLFCLLAVFGCSNNEKDITLNTKEVISFNFESKPENIHTIGLIKNAEIIPLLGREFLGTINKIVSDNGLLYFFDKNNQSVSIYDTTGVFINKIQHFGRAANEYSQLVDVFADAKKNQVKLLSRIDRKVFTYSADGKTLLAKDRVPKAFTNIVYDEYGYWAFSANFLNAETSKNLWQLDSSYNIKAGFFDINPAFASYALGNIHPFSKFQSNYYYIEMMNNIVYKLIRNEDPIPYYRFDFGNKNWPKQINNLAAVDDMSLEEKEKFIQSINIFQETEKFLIAKVLLGGQILLCVYNKVDKKSHITTLDPYAGKYFFSFGDIIGIDEKAIYTLVSADAVQKFIKGKDDYNDFESKYPKQIAQLRERFKHLKFDDNSNPFLVTYEID